MDLVVLILDLGLILVILGFCVYAISMMVSDAHGAPYVPIEQAWIKPILTFAELKAHEGIADLGCGDGRVLRTASSMTDGPLHGYELSLWPYWKAKILNRYYRTPHIKIQRSNIFDVTFTPGVLLYAYLYPKLLDRVAQKIEKECAPGTRLVSPRFAVNTERHPRLKKIKEGMVATIPVYLYEVVS